MLHVGHVRTLWQARLLGDCLVVGAQSDADIIKHKGPPVYPEQERFRLIKAVKFVDEFAGAASYGTTVETLDEHDCAFCVHGDDATLRASETDLFKRMMKINRGRLVRRHFGPSTTTQIQRVLERSACTDEIASGESQNEHTDIKTREGQDVKIMFTPTAAMIRAFSDGRVPQTSDRIVYVDGAFDLFNVGHLAFLEAAAKEGSYLLVGIHDDSTVATRKGPVHPVLTMMERALFVLSLKCVSDVIFGAPASLTEEYIETHRIDVVCHGNPSVRKNPDGTDPYAVPKKLGILKEVDSGCEVTSQAIVDRIVSKREHYKVRNRIKMEKELLALEALQSVY